MKGAPNMVSAELVEAREFANRLRENLPARIDAAALGVWSKAPFQLLCAREALIWRSEELARNACDALEREDLSVAALLTRALTENAALVWKLWEILDARHSHSPQELNDLLIRLLVGSRKWPDGPQAMQILSSIDRMDKAVPGVRASYDSLSEIAHPNWSGVAGLYSKPDPPRYLTDFGRGLRDTKGTADMIANALLGSLGLFELAYNRISEAMPEFLAELEPI
ncbi:hypothetical protein LB572_13770 [Mesorhizobium sp. BH1-1-5]|uniref:hypothetical protein n=1 Tax=Mesorhizobium sp. BH1-1-5 TaxID=2876661 RepID=UPI001CCC50CB|nr:hypothetical protein [Mesorhizobium sp. BH1-1-5]MBZ9988161.1 hypothetical protein [Mesorhizobium sp. BH1-1-5]